MGHTDHQNFSGVVIRYMQVRPFIQRNPADGLGLDLGQLGPEVCFNRGHEVLRELERIANRLFGQRLLQGIGISQTGGLVSSRLRLQAGQFLVAELHGDQLCFGFVREFVGVVVNVVDFDDGHTKCPFIKKPHPLVRDGVLEGLPAPLACAWGIGNR